MGIRQVRIGCDFVYDAQVDTPTVFQVTPLGVDGVDIQGEKWSFAPTQDSHEYRDIYGNRCQRIILPTGPFADQLPGDGHRAGRHRGLRPVRRRN